MLLYFFIFLSALTFANDSGVIAGTSGALYFIQEVVRKVCLLSSIATLLCAMMRFIAYRKNPSAVKISQPIWLFIIGLSLLLLVYLPSPLDGSQYV